MRAARARARPVAGAAGDDDEVSRFRTCRSVRGDQNAHGFAVHRLARSDLGALVGEEWDPERVDRAHREGLGARLSCARIRLWMTPNELCLRSSPATGKRSNPPPGWGSGFRHRPNRTVVKHPFRPPVSSRSYAFAGISSAAVRP